MRSLALLRMVRKVRCWGNVVHAIPHYRTSAVMTRRVRLLWVVLLLGLSFQEALADETQVTPSIAVQTQYNDNIFLDSTNELADYRLNVTPAIALTSRTERLDSNLSVAFPINRYADLDELNAVDQIYSGGLRYQWSPRIATSIQAGYLRDSQPDRDLLETGLVLGTGTRHRLSAGLSGDYAISEWTTAGLSYAYGDEKFKGPGYTDSDYQTLNFVLTRNMERTFANTYGRLTLSGSRYEFTPSTFDWPRNNVKNAAVMVGAVRRLTDLYSLSADIGLRYTRREYEVPRLEAAAPGLFRIVSGELKDEDVGGVGRAVLSYQGESLRASFSAYQDIATSGGSAGLVQRTAFTFDVGKRFTYKLWGHFAASYYLNTSKGRELSLQEIDEKTGFLTPYLRYEYSRDLRFEASYSFGRINDRTNNTDAERNVVFLRVVYFHPLLQ